MLDNNEKKLVYISIAIILVLVLVILVIIWSPMFTSKEKIAKITSVPSYENGHYVNEKKEEYKNIVKKCINRDNFDYTYEILDEDYINNVNMDKEELREYLISQKIITYPSSSMVIYCSCVRNDGKRYIYTYTYKIGNIERKIHIVEDYINTYTISFEQESYPVVNNKEYNLNDKVTGLEFKLKPLKCYEENILMEIDIINNTTEEYTFKNFENDSSCLIYSENAINQAAYLSSIIVGQNTSEVVSTPGSINKITLSYGINISQQESISMLVFKDVIKSNGEEISVELSLI